MPTTCGLNTTASDALSTMHEHDYSQLPVTDVNDILVGMVTVDTIARAIVRFKLMPTEFSVKDAMNWKPRVRSEDEDITSALLDLEQVGAVIIADKSKRVKGIITDYDTAGYFRSKAEDILLIEDIETTLRSLAILPFRGPGTQKGDEELERAVANAIAPDREESQFKAAVSNYLDSTKGRLPVDEKKLADAFKILTEVKGDKKSVDDLTFSEIMKMWLAESRWEKYSNEVTLDRTNIAKMLDEVRKIRNKVFHFRGDVSRDESHTLESCRDWLHGHLQLLIPLFSEPEEEIEKSIEEQTQRIKEALEGSKQVEVNRGNSETPLESPNENEDFKVSKYAALGRWLHGIPDHINATWLSFSKLEELLDAVLPKSALIHRSWWANDWNTHSQARLWLEEGWETDIVDFDRERIRFRRV